MKPDNSRWLVLAVIAGIVGAFAGPALMREMGGFGRLLLGLIFLGAIGYVIYILAGNKVGRTAPVAVASDARALVAAPGTARIYVVRRGFMGGMAGMKVAVAGVAAGQIRMNQFVMAEVAPGTYTVGTAMARNGAKPSDSQSTVTLAAGEVAVIQVMLEMHALHASTVQQRLPMAEARTEIASAKMVLWNEQGRRTAPAMA